jgi:iron complex outermembrane receptor protein
MGSACVFVLATSAFAQTANVDIPAGDLKAAVDQYAQQSGTQVIYSPDDLAGRRTPGIHGNLTPEQALGQLLSGTDLVAKPEPGGALGIGKKTRFQKSSSIAPAAASDASASVEVVTVTAQKRSEDLQTIPFSIQAVSDQTLRDHQTKSFDDYAKLLPSVSFQSLGPGESQLFFRGVTSGADGNPFGALPTAGIYLDETPVTTTGSLLDVHMYDIARVEALSGPQGTLFGASSLAGTLRIITNKPDPSQFKAGYDLEANTFGGGGPGGTVQGFVNLPLNDRIAVRLVGFYEHDGGNIDNTPGSRTYQRPHTLADGSVVNSPLTVDNAKFVQSDFNDATTFGGRLALGIDLNDDWTITPQIVAQNQHTNGTFLYDPHAGALKVHDFTGEYSNDKWYQASLLVNGKIGDWDLIYSGGYMGRHDVAVQDYSYYTVAYDSVPNYTYFQNANGTPLNPSQIAATKGVYTKKTHELRVSSPTGRRFNVTGGLFYERQTDLFTQEVIIPGSAASQQANSGYVIPGGGDDVFINNANIIDRDRAIFVQADYKILPDLTFTAGIRGFDFDNTVVGFSGGAGTAATYCGGTFTAKCVSLNKEVTGSGETHKLSLSWQVDDSRMLYATYSTGYRPGGINRPIGFAPFNSDTLKNYEAGWKTEWLNDALRFNGAIYREVWDGVQYALPGANGTVSVVNAGNAHIDGFETEVDAVLGDLRLSGSGSYNYARLVTPFCTTISGVAHCDLGIAAPSGTDLPVTPRFKGNATARYNFEMQEIPLYAQLALFYQSGNSSLLTVSQNSALGNVGPFATVDFSLGGTLKNGMTVELFVKNIFNELGALSRTQQCTLTSCLMNGRTYPIQPQLVGIKMGQQF